MIDRVDVLGVHISAVNMDMAVAEIGRWIDQGERHYVCVTGVHGVMESQGDSDLVRIHNESGLTTPDGMPMVWAGHRAGAAWMERVYGPDLMLAVFTEAINRGWKMFFYGGAEGVVDDLEDRMWLRFPAVSVVGSYTPPFRPLTTEEGEEVVQLINDSGADIVWIGMSTPKQEKWMDQFRSLLQPAALIGVGAAFDIHAGRLSQAPRWMQRTGTEWLYRLLKEPRRLWRRYLSNNPRFVWKIWRRPPRFVEI